MIYLLIFILGLCVGSFLNVIIYRETSEEKKIQTRNKNKKHLLCLPDWIWGRSYCDHCHKQIAWYDNIPLFSYFILKGQCRFCRKRITFQYPLVEILTGIEFVWIFFLIKSNLNIFSRFEGFYSFLSLAIWLGLGASLLAIFIADLKYQIIPDAAVFGAICVAFIKILIDYRYTGMIDFSLFWSSLLAGFLFASLCAATKGKGMGGGDIKLAFLIGLVLGFPLFLVALFFSFLTGALVGVILILLGKKSLKSKIAFGPFLIMGLVFALIYGEKIRAYFN